MHFHIPFFRYSQVYKEFIKTHILKNYPDCILSMADETNDVPIDYLVVSNKDVISLEHLADIKMRKCNNILFFNFRDSILPNMIENNELSIDLLYRKHVFGFSKKLQLNTIYEELNTCLKDKIHSWKHFLSSETNPIIFIQKNRINTILNNIFSIDNLEDPFFIPPPHKQYNNKHDCILSWEHKEQKEYIHLFHETDKDKVQLTALHISKNKSRMIHTSYNPNRYLESEPGEMKKFIISLHRSFINSYCLLSGGKYNKK